MTSTYSKLLAVVIAGMFVISACGGDDGETSEPDPSDTTATSEVTVPEGDDQTADSDDTGTTEPVDDGTDTTAPDGAGPGTGVILADLCTGGQPLNGAISLDDFVTYGMLSSTNATIDGGPYDAFGYETFGFLCNISEEVGDGENFVTIGIGDGSDTWDLAAEQDSAVVEQMGDWDVIIGTNWLSPLTMRFTDSAGNQDSLYVIWTTADGVTPDAETLERVMRPLAEAIATKSTVDIPRS